MFKKIKDKIKNKGFFGKGEYGTTWQERSGEEQSNWYKRMHESCIPVHEHFMKYMEKCSINTVLEIGCGTGQYPIGLKHIFNGKKYTGLDISQTAIDYCKTKSDFEFICTDFLKKKLNREFDLVYSHAVIDHVYDIELFIKNIIKLSNKNAYITSYRGYFPDLENHKMNWNDSEGSYYNDISVKQITHELIDLGLKRDEFMIDSIKVASEGSEDDFQTIIQINKKEKN